MTSWWKVTPLLITCPAGTGEGNLVEAEALLAPYQQKYPKVPQRAATHTHACVTSAGVFNPRCVVCCSQGSIILFYSARISTLRGHFEKVRNTFPR